MEHLPEDGEVEDRWRTLGTDSCRGGYLYFAASRVPTRGRIWGGGGHGALSRRHKPQATDRLPRFVFGRSRIATKGVMVQDVAHDHVATNVRGCGPAPKQVRR